MFSALKKLTKINDDRCPAPMPMSSSLQKKFSRGVHFNMKILIKGDRNVGKSCLLQRLQGGAFIEDYVPTDQIQVAPIHWAYKNTDYIVKVEVWEVVDKGRTKKKAPLGLKLENQAPPTVQEDSYESPVLDATFLDVYKNANGVILMLDITKIWTFEYVVKELSRVPADLPVVILGNHCDMQHHRQVHPHHIEQALHHAKLSRTAPVRYAESSMRNGFGLRLLHKFLNIPFLKLQKTSLLEQLQRNQKDIEETEKELDNFQSSEESHYETFVDRLANKRRQSNEIRPINDRSPSIVLGAGKPIIPPNVNPLLAQSLNPSKPQSPLGEIQPQLNQYVSPELYKPKHQVSMEMTPSRPRHDSAKATPTGANVPVSGSGLDEFYAGTLDSSFLEDLAPLPHTTQEIGYETDSDDESVRNPRVTVDEDDLDIEVSHSPPDLDFTTTSTMPKTAVSQTMPVSRTVNDVELNKFLHNVNISNDDVEDVDTSASVLDPRHRISLELDSEFPMWAAGDSSARRSPEG
ncbi:rab-like protein 6 isoform X2 [Plodia interpunctella]|nr:rab-like protein 6 isoform X2 [Plodia interpunctella]